jgi:hypothetical protein
MRNIALSGKARSGKDTVAKYLCEEHGYTRLAFADPLKEMALSVDPLIPAGRVLTSLIHVRLSALIADTGWDYAKAHYPEVRRTLQQMGQTVRERDSAFWIRTLVRSTVGVDGPIVVTDMRYANEYSALSRAGFVPVRVSRPGAGLGGSAGAHDSETDLDRLNFTDVITNDGSIMQLHHRIDYLLAHLN